MHDDVIAGGAAVPAAAELRRRWFGLLAVLLGQFMLVLDATVVNVALPEIRDTFSLHEAELTWINNAYLIAFGGLLMLFGRLGDLIGRRRVFVLGIAGFTLASAACGLANSAELLIAARFVQGIGAAAASSVVLAIIATEFPEPRDRSRAMSGYMFVSVAGGSAGLLVGGALTQAIDWHWIFLINIPVGVATIPLARRFLHEGAGSGLAGGIDVWGGVLVTSAAMAAIYAVVSTGAHPWLSPQVALPGAAALVLVVAFLVLESRLANPLMPLRILRIRSLMASSVVRGFLIMGMFAVFFFGVLDLSTMLGYGPLRVGLSFLPQTTIVAVLSLGITARLITRFGARRVLLVGLSLLAIALWTFARRDATAPYWPGRLISFMLVGFGAGLSFLPLLTIAMADVPPRDAGLGSAIISLSLQLAAAVDLAILGAAAAHRTATLRGVLPAREALVAGYRTGYAVAAGGVLVGLVLSMVLLRDPPPRPTPA